MGRTETAARPAPGSRAGRALAVVLAAIALLVCGAVDVLPRSAAGPLAATSAAAAPAPAARAGALEAPASSLGLRSVALPVVPTSPGGGLPPGAGPLVAPHLVPSPQGRPPTTAPPTSPAGTSSSRAPPGPAGT
jgi:hypothetical protein